MVKYRTWRINGPGESSHTEPSFIGEILVPDCPDKYAALCGVYDDELGVEERVGMFKDGRMITYDAGLREIGQLLKGQVPERLHEVYIYEVIGWRVAD